LLFGFASAAAASNVVDRKFTLAMSKDDTICVPLLSFYQHLGRKLLANRNQPWEQLAAKDLRALGFEAAQRREPPAGYDTIQNAMSFDESPGLSDRSRLLQLHCRRTGQAAPAMRLGLTEVPLTY